MNTVIRTGWWQGLQQLNYTVCYRALGKVVSPGKWKWAQKMDYRCTHLHTRARTHTYLYKHTHTNVCTNAQYNTNEGSLWCKEIKGRTGWRHPVVCGFTYRETQRSTVPFVSWFSSSTLCPMQTRFTLRKKEKQEMLLFYVSGSLNIYNNYL